jgi:hypothetical protein
MWEAQIFTNNVLLAETITRDAENIGRELQRFLYMRNKLVHRARLEHPLVDMISERAKRRLYDLIGDLSAQLATRRIRNSVPEVLNDYKDTFRELLHDLGSQPSLPDNFADRILLA